MARRPRGRAQVDDPLRRLPEQRVRPMAPDVFVGAPSVSGAGDGLRDLASALSGFAGTVGGLQKVFEARREQEREAAASEWGTLPREERERRFQLGIGPTGEKLQENPIISKAQGIDYAAKAADEFDAHLQAGNFDMTGDMNVDVEMFNFLDPVHESFKANPYLQEGFRNEWIRRRDKLMTQQTELRLKAAENKAKDGVQSTLRAAYSRMKEGGADPDTMFNELSTIRNDLAPQGRAAVGLPPQEIDNMAFRLADEIAEDDPVLARKLLMEPRKGQNGEVVGPIGNKSENLEQTNRILGRIVAAEKKKVEISVEDKATEALLVRGLKGENIADDLARDVTGQYADGSPLKLSSERVKKAVFEKWKIRSADTASKTNEPPERARRREIEELTRMGITNPDWEALFKALPQTLTEQAIQDPNTQGELLETFQLYKEGRSISKYFIDAHMDKNSKKLLDLAYIAETRLGQTSDQALMSALRASDPENDDEGTAGLSRAIEKKVDNDYVNGGVYSRLVKDTARAYVKLGGLSAEEAVEAAVARLDQEGAEVHGGFVEIPRDPKTGKAMLVPDDFGDLAEQTIERWFDKYGDSTQYKPSDLTLRGSPNGLFEIVDKMGNPVLGVNLEEGTTYASPVLKMSDFLETKRSNEEAELKSMVNDQNIEQTVNNEGYMAGVLKYMEELNKNNPTLGDSIAAHATVASKLAKKGFRQLGNTLYPKTPQFSRDTYRLPGETK